MNQHPPRLAAVAVATFALLAPSLAGAAGDIDVEGRYELVQPPQPTETGEQVEVLDVFWYGCPHCYDFLPHMERWQEARQPGFIEVRRMPAVFRDSWVAHARAFYTARQLGIADEVHRPLFDAIHVEKRRMNTPDELADFFARHGVDRDIFLKTYDSFAVNQLVRRSVVMQERYGVRGTPSVIVNGKYRVTGSLAGGYPGMIEVIEALAEREHEAMQSQ